MEGSKILNLLIYLTNMADERVNPGITEPVNIMKHIARYILPIQVLKSDSVVLDAGCGVGYGSNMLSWFCKRVIGVDISEEAIKTAIKVYSRDNITFIPQDMHDFAGLLDGKFDSIVAFEFLEHLKDPRPILMKFVQWLKPGGYLFYSSPVNKPKDFNEHHAQHYSPEQFRKLFPDEWKKEFFRQEGLSFVPADPKLDTERGYMIGIIRKPDSKFNYTTDWTTKHIADWDKYIKLDRTVSRILEIGCYEGRTTNYFANKYPNAHISVIDTFDGSGRLANQETLFDTFMENTKDIADRIGVHKGRSQEIVPEMLDMFDLIYVDGSHTFEDALADLTNSWKRLKTGGYIIVDDYARIGVKDAVRTFMENADDAEVIFTNEQAIIKKMGGDIV